MKKILENLLSGKDLSQQEAKEIMIRIMSGEFDDAQIAGFLVALRAKGETSNEIAGFSRAMREKMTSIPISSEAIDLCGTGGDGKGTFNISTAASFVVAGAGVKVAKHGNRSMTSRSGSADVISALGVDISMSPEKMAMCVEKTGLGFLFAPALHPAMKHAVGPRKSLGIRTVFNVLGPLCNPAEVKRQLIGIFDGTLTEKIAVVLKKLGSTEAFIVHGRDGMDEITTTSTTKISHLKVNGEIDTKTLSPLDYGIEFTTNDQLQGGLPEENAKIIKNILTGRTGPQRDIVVLNAAAAIRISGKADSIEKGIQMAEASIDSGKALTVLQNLASA